MAATCGWTFGGAALTSIGCERSRRSWSACDPAGFVAGLNQPGGNITGFGLLEASLGGKWLELLSEIAPGLKRAAIMFNPDAAVASTYTPDFFTRLVYPRRMGRSGTRPQAH
jgi:hypothetical protein